MGGKKKKGRSGASGGKAKKVPSDDSDLLNPPESRDDFESQLDQLELSDELESRDGSQTTLEHSPQVPQVVKEEPDNSSSQDPVS